MTPKLSAIARTVNIARWTGRCLIVALVLATGLQLLLLMRTLTTSNPSSSDAPQQTGPSLSTPIPAELFSGSWQFKETDSTVQFGRVSAAGFNAIEERLATEFGPSQNQLGSEPCCDSEPRFDRLLGLVQPAIEDQQPTRHLFFGDLEDPSNSAVLIGFQSEPDRWWYLCSEGTDRVSSRKQHTSILLRPPGLELFARKLDDQSNAQLEWWVAPTTPITDAELLNSWDSAGVQFEPTLTPKGNRFDYTCEWQGRRIRALGRGDGNGMTNLVLIRQ